MNTPATFFFFITLGWLFAGIFLNPPLETFEIVVAIMLLCLTLVLKIVGDRRRWL